jgi:hypothetical protein
MMWMIYSPAMLAHTPVIICLMGSRAQTCFTVPAADLESQYMALGRGGWFYCHAALAAGAFVNVFADDHRPPLNVWNAAYPIVTRYMEMNS